MKVLLFPALLTVAILTSPPKGTRWTGNISNGMKGDKVSFVVSADGKRLSDLTFTGYWRCSGKLESTTVAPKDTFLIQNGKVSGVVTDLADGSTARHFELQGNFANKTTAKGDFLVNSHVSGCDTYKLEWAAVPTP